MTISTKKCSRESTVLLPTTICESVNQINDSPLFIPILTDGNEQRE